MDDRVYRTYPVEVTSPRMTAGAISPESHGQRPEDMLAVRGRIGYSTVKYRANSRRTMYGGMAPKTWLNPTTNLSRPLPCRRAARTPVLIPTVRKTDIAIRASATVVGN